MKWIIYILRKIFTYLISNLDILCWVKFSVYPFLWNKRVITKENIFLGGIYGHLNNQIETYLQRHSEGD